MPRSRAAVSIRDTFDRLSPSDCAISCWERFSS